MAQDSINREDPALKRWLDSMMRQSTRYVYRTAFRVYATFTGMSASSLIDEALADLKKDPRDRQDVVLTRLVKFYQWLKTEYPKKTRGVGEHQIIGKGEQKGTFKTVGDKEHAEIIRLYIEEELAINKIAEIHGRSSRTPLVQIQRHDRMVKRSGFCPSCRRVKSKFESATARKGSCRFFLDEMAHNRA